MDPNNPSNNANQDGSNQTAPQTDPEQTNNAQSDVAQQLDPQQDISQNPVETAPQTDSSTATTDGTGAPEQPADQTQTSPVVPPVQTNDTSAAQPDPNASQVQDTAAQVNPDTPQENTIIQAPTDAQQTSPTDQTAPATPIEGGYIEDVGEDLIDLLDEISEDESLIQAVADEMRLDKERVKGILTKLLTKIDQGQITEEELALIMASTVADELLDKE